MSIIEILNLIAIILIPVFAVVIGQYLQNRALIRNEKIRIFKILMTYRNIGYKTMYCVEALNQVPILFMRNKKGMKSYNEFIELMNVVEKDEQTLSKAEREKKKLLEAMAKSLHYSKINWEIIETPYLPPEILENQTRQQRTQQDAERFISRMNQLVGKGEVERFLKFLESGVEEHKKGPKPKKKSIKSK